MCVFHVSSLQHSFRDFIANTPQLPVYQIHEKGEGVSSKDDTSIYEDYGFSCDVSERDWNDVEGQIIDIISFLEVYAPYLQSLKESHQVDDWRFDLPYESRLDEQTFTQIDFLPPKLMRLVGALEIGIELSLYHPSVSQEEEL